VQIGAMNVDEWAVEARFARRVENKLVGRFAGIPGAAEERIGANACRGQSALKIEPAQHFCDVGSQNDAGADP
jgi:hypothetical protein